MLYSRTGEKAGFLDKTIFEKSCNLDLKKSVKVMQFYLMNINEHSVIDYELKKTFQ